MDILSQTKLTASEWESIEIPVPESEMKILTMMHDGYGKDNVNRITNPNLNMIRFTKLSPSPEIHAFLYGKYFYPIIQSSLQVMKSKYKPFAEYRINNTIEKIAKKLKKADKIRIETSDQLIQTSNHSIFEFDCMRTCNTILQYAATNKSFVKPLYVLLQWNKASIDHTNPHVKEFVQMVVDYGRKYTSISTVIENADTIVEKNAELYKYENLSLYMHQRELYTHCLQPNKRHYYEDEDIEETGPIDYTPKPKLILYCAPTGTGKTLSPIGLINEYKIIFVCVARHVGLALAKSAISLHKRVGFAFGCDSPSDIRLHYFSAADYTKNRRTGGIWKVNHSDGSKVEMMICDVHSYLHAMRYMMAHTKDHSTLLTYWDEPTMTLDYEDHPLHKTIQKNWAENQIYNMVLSCATLPKEEELQECIMDFRNQVEEYFDRIQCEKEAEQAAFVAEIEEDNAEGALEAEELGEPYTPTEIVFCPYIPLKKEDYKTYYVPYKRPDVTVDVRTISSYDCRKSIPILNQQGYSFIPHIHCSNHEELKQYSGYCKDNKTLLRYFDLTEILEFIRYVHTNQYVTKDSRYYRENYFDSIEDVTMNKLKLYYLDLLSVLDQAQWQSCKTYLMVQQKKKYNKGGNALSRMSTMPMSNNNGGSTISRMNSESQVAELKKKAQMQALDGVFLTTKDAHTLTDGPSIYLADNILNMANFYVKESKIPDTILCQLVDGIVKNEKLMEKILELERKVDEQNAPKDSGTTTNSMGSKKGKSSSPVYKEKDEDKNVSLQNLRGQIDNLRDQMRAISLNPNYVPNTNEHQEKWIPGGKIQQNAFSGSLNEDDVKAIVEMDISIQYKVLVLMGVGVLIQQESKAYEEMVKRLANDQKLFLILTSSDYIYGTNYQFCHGFIGKDLKNMTPQKTIQAMGRVGRNKHQQDYTIRFRDDSMIHGLFKPPAFNREAHNMNKLFCSTV